MSCLFPKNYPIVGSDVWVPFGAFFRNVMGNGRKYHKLINSSDDCKCIFDVTEHFQVTIESLLIPTTCKIFEKVTFFHFCGPEYLVRYHATRHKYLNIRSLRLQTRILILLVKVWVFRDSGAKKLSIFFGTKNIDFSGVFVIICKPS